MVVIDQSRSAFGGGNLAGPHIMDSVSKALARSFGQNPSAGPAPAGAAQLDAEEVEGDDLSQTVNEEDKGEAAEMTQTTNEESDAQSQS